MSKVALLALTALLITAPAQSAEYPRFRIETTAGTFEVELDDERAPITVANFLRYVNAGHYENTVFHRIIPGFVVQGGGYTPDLVMKTPSDPIPNESGNGLSNVRGTIAMARTNAPHSADAQFYINLSDGNVMLDPKPTRWGYTVFGRVTAGMQVIDDMAARPTGPGGPFPSDVPAAPIIIESVVRIDLDGNPIESAPGAE